MGKKKTKSKRNNELKVIFFIILIAAALFIVSTYAWFSTQRNVSITNLNGTVEVAEGLEISLNAKNWYNGIVLGDEEGQFSITKAGDFGPYENHKNLMPTEMLPVSTLGKDYLYGDVTGLQMLRGKVTDSIKLSDIIVTDETVTNPEASKFAGYIAFDIFLKNSSKGTDADILQLNYDSSLQITESDKVQTGLQNTARIALARYGSELGEGDVWTGVSAVEVTDQAKILRETGAPVEGANTVYLTDVAIWEPNAGDHAQYIVDNNQKLTWSTTDAALYATKDLGEGKKGFDLTTQMPTYALKQAAVGASIANLYNWDGTTNAATLEKQTTLQTNKTSDTDYTIKEGVQNLISTSDATGKTNFTIAPNSIVRLRVYVWLEGQDIDCINYASHGGGISINLGIVKGSTVGATEAEAETE